MVDKRIETLSEEIKLLKGELKQSLASVRDYLLNMELPSSEFANMLDALDSGDGQKVTMTGSFSSPVEDKMMHPQEEVSQAGPYIPEDENLIDVEEPAPEPAAAAESGFAGEQSELAPEESYVEEEEPLEEIQSKIPEELDEIPAPDAELPPEEDLPLDYEKTITAGTSLATPKVNMLANLVTWVAKAKKEIGYERLPMLLEVYGISGHLSSELKEIILQLAEITGDNPEVASEPALWSEAMLSLHGILTGGDAPLHPIAPFVAVDEPDAEEPEEEKPEPPFKLKLVLPGGDGKEKEFCINLTPEEENSDGAAG